MTDDPYDPSRPGPGRPRRSAQPQSPELPGGFQNPSLGDILPPIIDSTLNMKEGEIPPHWEVICLEYASGKTIGRISSERQAQHIDVKRIVEDPRSKLKIKEFKDRIIGESLQRHVAMIAPPALEYLEKVVRGEEQSNSARQDAAKWAAEMVLGKPKQKVEGDAGLGILQLLQSIDKLIQGTSVREANDLATAIEMKPEENAIDSWVRKNLPKDTP